PSDPDHPSYRHACPRIHRTFDAVGHASLARRTIPMSPAPPLGSWWMDHLQLPGYDPIATAGPSRFDPRAAEQALGFFIQLLSSPLSRWEEAIILNLWGWRQAQGQR